MHRLQDLVRLHRLKTGARETARLLGMGPNTERQYREAIAAAGLLDGAPETLPAVGRGRWQDPGSAGKFEADYYIRKPGQGPFRERG